MHIQRLSEWVSEQYAEAGRSPEFEHLTRVAGLARSNADRAVAWLHDIVEDDIVTLDDVHAALDRLTEFSDDEIASFTASVEILRRRKADGEQYDQYINRVVASDDERALRVKQLDLIDHIDPYHRHGLRAHQATRYLAALQTIVQSSLKDVNGAA